MVDPGAKSQDEPNIKQRQFVDRLMECGSKSQAYISVYGRGDCTDKTFTMRVNRLLRNPKVQAYMEELKRQHAERNLWRREDSIRILAEIAKDWKAANTDRINSVKELNRMHGWDRVVVDHTSSDGSMSPTRIEITAPSDDNSKD